MARRNWRRRIGAAGWRSRVRRARGVSGVVGTIPRRRRYAVNPRRRRRNPKGYVYATSTRGWIPVGARVRRRSKRARRRFVPPRGWIRGGVRAGAPRPRSRRRPAYGKIWRNPPIARALPVSSDPITLLKSAVSEAFSLETLGTVSQLGLGFFGSLAAARFLSRQGGFFGTPAGRVVATLGSAVVGSSVLGVITKNRNLFTRALTGGLFATTWRVLSEILPADQAFIPTLGDAGSNAEGSDALRQAIEAEVLRELQGNDVNSAGAAQYVEPAGVSAYLTGEEARRAAVLPPVGSGVSAYLTQREVEQAVAAGLGESGDEFAPEGAGERF